MFLLRVPASDLALAAVFRLGISRHYSVAVTCHALYTEGRTRTSIDTVPNVARDTHWIQRYHRYTQDPVLPQIHTGSSVTANTNWIQRYHRYTLDPMLPQIHTGSNVTTDTHWIQPYHRYTLYPALQFGDG